MSSSGYGPKTGVDPAPVPPSASVQDQLRGLLEEDFRWAMADNPEWASQAGFHQNQAMLQDLSPASFELRVEHNNEMRKKLKELDLNDESITEENKLHAELFDTMLAEENAAFELGCHLMPINSIGVGGVHYNFIELLDWMVYETEKDWENYILRICAFGPQAQGYQDLLAYGAMRKIVASKAMMRKVPEQLDALIKSNFDDFRQPGGNTPSEQHAKQIDEAIEKWFRPGLIRLKDFFDEFYAGRLRDDPGCGALPQGSEIYVACLKYHTTTPMTPDEIHQRGHEEVARIQGRYQSDVLDKLGYKGTIAEFIKELKADKSQYYETEAEVIAGYQELADRITKLLPKYFKTLPKSELEIVAKPGAGPAAYYFAGTPDGKRPGRFHVNTSHLDERPKYQMPALALHEGVPGHHLQGALAIENEGLPDFLRYIEDRRYEFCPARRPLLTAYLEGWALYCEHLGEEMGMYDTPYELFGRLSMEMMRAVRLVVDTGIHAKGWSVEKAIEYMQDKTGMHRHECETECYRYASWPGQACGYKVGQLAIEEARRKAEEMLGSKFSLPDFHEVLLGSGPLPLDLLAARVESWASKTSKL